MATKKKRRRSSLPSWRLADDVSELLMLVALVKLSAEVAVLKAEIAALRAHTS